MSSNNPTRKVLCYTAKMVYAKGGRKPKSKPNRTYELKKNVYLVGGIPVEFPFRPYGSQLEFMGRVISTLDRAQREGHCHALLESPTGTGKSLSLLCSSLAWQKNYKIKNQDANSSHTKPAPEAATDPLGFGGGFLPEVQTSSKFACLNPDHPNISKARIRLGGQVET